MNNLIKTKQGTRREKRREIKKLDDVGQRHVTFSKRRVGIINKASELCALTGAQCAIICESYGGRIFAFGHPSVESVVDKYLGDKTSTSSSQLLDNNSETADVYSLCDKLNKQYLDIMQQLEIEKNKSLTLKRQKDENSNDKDDLFWWEQPFEHLDVQELEDYITSMEKLRNKLISRADDLKVIKTSSMFDATKTANSNDSGLSDEFYSDNKNLIAKDVGFMQDLLVNDNLDFKDDNVLNELLATMNDDGLDDILNDFYLQTNNVQVPNTYGNTGNGVQLSHGDGNLAVPRDYGKAVDLPNIDYNNALPPNDFSFLFPRY